MINDVPLPTLPDAVMGPSVVIPTCLALRLGAVDLENNLEVYARVYLCLTLRVSFGYRCMQEYWITNVALRHICARYEERSADLARRRDWAPQPPTSRHDM